MTYLFFDTETTGLPNSKMPIDWEGQPHICQIGAILTTSEGNVLGEMNLIIRPDNWEIPENASKIHGITQQHAEQYGVSMKAGVGLLRHFCKNAKLIIAHNLEFDIYLLNREETAIGLPLTDIVGRGYCTMRNTTDIVKLPPSERMRAAGMTGHKPPNLQECHKHFLGYEFEGAHDAMADVRACRDVFFKMTANKDSVADKT